MISQATLKKLIDYDPLGGVFTWRVNRGRLAKAGQVAGTKRLNDGYIQIKVCGHLYLAHVLAGFYMLGEWRDGETDHKNGIRDDNRWANIRYIPKVKNLLNRKTYLTNTSGHKGVTWHSQNRRWRARIQLHGKRIDLGCYSTKEEAEKAYKSGEKIHYGEFARVE